MKAKILIGGLAALFATVALASAFYVGYNPLTGQTGVVGVPVATGTMPTLNAGTSCGTLATVQASELGGSGTVSFVANATTCTLSLTMPLGQGATAASPAPNGVFCVFIDETHPADIISQASHTTTTCTSSAATVVSGDTILVEINEF